MTFIYNFFYHLIFKRNFYEETSFLKWVTDSKVLIILRGPLGTKNKILQEHLKNFRSGDFSIETVSSLLKEGCTQFCVDVPSITVSGVMPFVNFGNQNYFMTIIPDFMNSWKDNSVNVPPSGDVKALKTGAADGKFEKLPVYYAGWFLSDTDQEKLHKIGRRYLDELWKIDNVRLQLQRETGSTNVNDYWPQQKQRLHVTSKFIGKNPNDDYMDRANSKLYSISGITVAGILMTPRTLSCHVILDRRDSWLFDDQELVTLKPHATLAVGGTTKAVQSGPDQVEVQTLIKQQVAPKVTFATAMGTVNDYGQCRFYLTLPKKEQFQALFNVIY